MSYKKVGGIHFVKIGSFGFNFYWSSKPKKVTRSKRASVKPLLLAAPLRQEWPLLPVRE